MITAAAPRVMIRTATAMGGRMALRALTTRACSNVYQTSTSWSSNKLIPGTSRIFPSATTADVRFKSTVPLADEPSARDEYNVSTTVQGTDACLKVGIHALGITNPTTLYRNLTFQELFEHEQVNQEGQVANAEYGDTFTIDTGKFTGRSPKDKFLVKNVGSVSDQEVDWNNVNQSTSPEVYEKLYRKAVDHFNTRDTAYVFDGYCGASPASRKKIRFVHEMAWQQHFVTNMFIRPETSEEIQDFGEPDFTVINCCSQVVEDWEELGLNSDTAVVFNIEERTAVIFGTWYGGENKKGIFSLMNYWLPLAGDFPMHCSANVGKDGDSTLFFGLSGTGKTTLSADPHRALIGDDEHGWDSDGIFNFEGGCYAKTINLSEKTEPDIYRAIKTDAMLENVALEKDENDKLVPDYFDTTKTENGRVSYPIFHINNYHKPQMADHPKNIIFLSCDAFGVLPPVAELSTGQAMYHFLSGYTAKVAGTERGVTEPTATFSACFGAAFLTLHPTRYADLLQQKLEEHGAKAYLVNSGWSGGPYGVGDRMSIATTRACIDAILDGSMEGAPKTVDPTFGFAVPTQLNNVDPLLLNPKATWPNPAAFEEQQEKLAKMYVDNFHQYDGKGTTDYTQYGPKL
mmetsp:Transcript_31755/g.47190  ORF Transcript_31755/g.47190 Transcript_31755/m.47190 type:complete len:629 (-) Transcript_31755:195-2081(-)|eukprot:CAMPEP_0194049046 /NCGR_PEP_ID=MMETSP0009_2-20130614/29472_1 /TAXON_ID=210454 /ORGANISM="Grammatophora oceanica, Strain CCMP 410" /LENGTH=628 /DNA_ID=CAMNT_0038695099 /DNA_START=70 /DNA_END=1956 /DNA_ORIENTATION=+